MRKERYIGRVQEGHISGYAAALQTRTLVAAHGVHRTLEVHTNFVKRRLRDGRPRRPLPKARTPSQNFTRKRTFFLKGSKMPQNFTRKSFLFAETVKNAPKLYQKTRQEDRNAPKTATHKKKFASGGALGA